MGKWKDSRSLNKVKSCSSEFIYLYNDIPEAGYNRCIRHYQCLPFLCMIYLTFHFISRIRCKKSSNPFSFKISYSHLYPYFYSMSDSTGPIVALGGCCICLAVILTVVLVPLSYSICGINEMGKRQIYIYCPLHIYIYIYICIYMLIFIKWSVVRLFLRLKINLFPHNSLISTTNIPKHLTQHWCMILRLILLISPHS